MDTVYDSVIIGGGPAGYTAALYCARSGLNVLVLEKLSPGGQVATTGVVDNYPGFENGIDGFDLSEKIKQSADRFGVQTAFEQVTEVSLSTQPKQVKTAAHVYFAKTVVLATGAYPRKLGLPEEDGLRGRGVAYCATCDGMLYKDKTVVVAGGGNSAAEDALFLEKLCKKVTLVHRREQLRASMVYQNALEKSSVEFAWNSRITQILHDKKVTGVQLENVRTGQTRTLPCDGVFVAVGRIPDTELFRGKVDLDEHGYFLAGETTQTSVPGVFAIGDARQKPMRQIVTATADGAVASKYVEEFIVSENPS